MLPLATAVFAAYSLSHQALLWVLRNRSEKTRFIARSVVSLAGLFALHGVNSFKAISIVLVNYLIAKHTKGTRIAPVATWLYAILVLFLLEWGRLPWNLPGWTGLVSGWHVTFNLTVLRLISFNMDYHWSMYQETMNAVAKHQASCEECSAGHCPKYRAMQPCEGSTYNVFTYLAYVFYLPLFIAGPIVSFNNFVSQTQKRTQGCSKRTTIIYGIRLIFSVLTLEAMLHFMWVVAIKDTSSWEGFSATQFSAVGLANLLIVWMKLLIIWRFFRFFALCDGIEAPENMERCIINNYSGFGFWRGWHRSFNLWIIRYMYIPMGGSKTSAWNVWPIFTFVALWHDFELKMLVWGWLIALFLLPELIATALAKKYSLSEHRHYRHICAVAGALNLLQVTICNLLGFALGLDGTKALFRSVFRLNQIPFVLCMLLLYFANVQIAFEVRESEKRRGIHRNF